MSDSKQTAGSLPLEERKVSRRGFLEWLIGILGGVTVVSIVGTALSFLNPPARGGGNKGPQAVADISQLPVGEGNVYPFNNSPAIVVNTEKGLVAFSAVCPHAQCTVAWDSKKKQIICPCHGGTFDLQGNVVSGPPPSPLPKYRVQVQGDKIMLDNS